MLDTLQPLTRTEEANQPDTGEGACLLVDDDKLLLELLSTAFRQQGYKVLTAPTGEMALRLARRHRLRFVLLDLGLPGRDGLQVLRSMRRCDKLTATPIVVLTGREVMTDLFDAYHLGADDYFVKPVRPAQLLARARELREARP